MTPRMFFSVEHVLIALVDLIEPVPPGDHVPDVELAHFVHRQQLRDIQLGVGATEDRAPADSSAAASASPGSA